MLQTKNRPSYFETTILGTKTCQPNPKQGAEMDLAPENEFVTLWEILNNVLLLWAGIFLLNIGEFNRFLLIFSKNEQKLIFLQFVKHYSN